MRVISSAVLAFTTALTVAVMWARGKWATSIPEVAMCVMAAVWATALLGAKRDVRRPWVLGSLGGIIALAAFQWASGVTVYPWLTRTAALYWAGNLATFFVALQIFQERTWRVRYLDGLLVFTVALAVFSLVAAMTSPPGTIYWTFHDPIIGNQVLGPFLYVNQYAAFIELILPIALYGALTRTKGRVLLVIGAAIMAGSVLYVGSRGGSALVALEFVAVLFLVSRRTGISRGQIINTVAVLGVALLWVAVFAGPDLLVGKLSHSNWLAGRREFNQSSLAMIHARPLQGFGLGTWATAYPGYASFDDGLHANQAHNDWLQWTVEGGIPMLLLMLSVAVWAIPRAVRSIWGIGVAIVFIHCLWDYPIQRTGVAIVFFTMMAAIASYGPARAGETAEPR